MTAQTIPIRQIANDPAPNLGVLVRDVRAADAAQNDAYDSGVEGFMDAADERKFDAEKALRDALIAQGVEPLDARSMVWGLS